MSTTRPFRLWKALMFPAVAAGTVTLSGLAWSDDPTPQADNPSQQTQPPGTAPSADQNSATLMDQHADDESPALGVIVGSCPGEGVCVHDTIWNSPADEAGLRQGDYILSVNGQTVSSPGELQQVVQKLKAGQDATVTVWRQGQKMDKQVTLASKADQPPESHKAWLGVMLAPADQEGVRIEQVVPASPAADAGLRSGDTIVKQGDQQVADVQSFVESVEDMGPGSPMQLTVLRNGSETKVDVTLGHTEAAPMQFLRAMRPAFDDPWAQGNGGNSNDSSGMLDDTLDQMRRQIRELQIQVQELQADKPQQPDRIDSQDLSQSSSQIDANGTTLVVQRGYRDRGRNWNRGRDWDNDRWDRGYRSRSRGPLYRSPRYGNYYYRYGGRPYYGNFGRGYGYGYGRNGIRIGNFGVYWY